MNELEYLAAALPEPVILLGQRLEPYSIGHEMLLRRYRNFFAGFPIEENLQQEETEETEKTGGTAPASPLSPLAPVQKSDADIEASLQKHLLQAVFLCCQKYPEALAMTRRPDLPELITKWRGRLGDFDAVQLAQDFSAYRRAGTAFPKYEAVKQRGSKRPRAAGAPWLAILFVTLTSKLGWTVAEALDCPYGLAVWLHLTFHERHGHVHIQTDEEREEARQVIDMARRMGLEPIRFTQN